MAHRGLLTLCGCVEWREAGRMTYLRPTHRPFSCVWDPRPRLYTTLPLFLCRRPMIGGRVVVLMRNYAYKVVAALLFFRKVDIFGTFDSVLYHNCPPFRPILAMFNSQILPLHF